MVPFALVFAVFVYLPWLFIGRYILGRNRIRSLNLPNLGISRPEFEKVVGGKSELDRDDDGNEYYIYEYGLHHAIRVWYNTAGTTIRYVIVSARSSPDDDLKTMMQKYGDGHKWNEINPGYLYCRDDMRIKLNCSVMPIIGVCLTENVLIMAAPN